jgi:hypothetical protein
MASRKTRRLVVVLLVALGCCYLVALLVSHYILPPYLIGYIRERSTEIVRERFQADVQFGSFDVTLLFPRLVIEGENVALTKRNRAGFPALIFVRKFSVNADLLRFLETPAHVQHIRLQGMSIHVPPRGDEPEQPKTTKAARQHYPVIIDHLECANCELNILPKRTGKQPLQFVIHQLNMQAAGLGRSAPYQAKLTNAVPKGEIQTSGRFGPWQPDEPSLTQLSGSYVFTHADLDPFPGISGTLDSKGRFEGILERIVADGETSTPDFALDNTDHPVALNTQFHAIIDGTSGDTALEPVKAQFLNSTVVARGGVFGTPGKKGKMILLDVTVNPGRMEDLLRLSVKGEPPLMTGNIRFHSRLEISPGAGRVAERLKLNDRFVATSVRPTSPDFQEKLKKLSSRAEGKPKDKNAGSDVFDLKGKLSLGNGVAHFPELLFTIPGARLQLAGQYGLGSENLDFEGTLHLQAKLSQTTTGWKSLVLKAVDPFFRGKDGGTILPVRIGGTRTKPSFKLARRKKSQKTEYRAHRLP